MTKMHHSALAQPDRSRLRKTSANTRISSQIQMNHRTSHNIDQNTSPVPHSAPMTMDLRLLLERAARSWTGRSREASPGVGDCAHPVGPPDGRGVRSPAVRLGVRSTSVAFERGEPEHASTLPFQLFEAKLHPP